MKKSFGEVLAEVFSYSIGILFCIGWILNLISFIGLNFSSPYRAEVIRGMGVVTPMGGVIGYFNIKD